MNYKKEYNKLLKKYNQALKEIQDLNTLLKKDFLKNSKVPVLYTDGSFDKNKQAGSWAFGTKDKIIDCGIITDLDGTWQIQSEVRACINAIKYAEAQGYEKVIICHDLKGLRNWYEGHWKANFPSTKELKGLKSQVKVSVSFNWVKGHIGIEGNELVDSKCEEILKNYEDLTK